MNDTTQAQNVAVAEDSNPPASPASEPTTSTEPAPAEQAPVAEPPAVPETPPAAQEAPATPEPTQPERQPRPAERRINELVQTNKELREQLSALPTPTQSPQAPKLSELVGDKPQIMPDELDQLGQKVWQEGAQTARGLNSLEVAQLRQEMVIRDAINETDKTAAQLPSEYDELNPKSSTYNPILEKKIVDTFQNQAVRQDAQGKPVLDTSVKLSDIAKSEVEFYREATESGKAQTSNTLASQADEAAVTPTSSSPEPDKSFKDMSMAEQEAYLRAQGHDI